MDAHKYLITVIILLFLLTVVTRALPFLFSKQMRDSALITFLGTRLPVCIILLLTIYYIIAMAQPTHWHNLPWQIIALIATLIVHWRWRNVTVSIFTGTAIYLVLNFYFKC